MFSHCIGHLGKPTSKTRRLPGCYRHRHAFYRSPRPSLSSTVTSWSQDPSLRKLAARKSLQGESKMSVTEPRAIRSTPDWGETANIEDHLWIATSTSGDMCHALDHGCTKQGPRMKCPACRIIAHKGCISIVTDKMNCYCKPTFKDVGVRQYREKTELIHHWVHRRSQKGRCKECGKSFQSVLPFGGKEIVAISCTWCKTVYHNKNPCFNLQRLGEPCVMGIHANLLVPPSWIVKLPRKGSFKSSLRKPPKRKLSTKRKPKKEGDKEQQNTFVIKPIPSASSKPLLVFINPKSGGNQGAKLLQKFQWLLNPRQVFDLSEEGPHSGLMLYKKVPNLRILACGGDGTVGWILSTLDEIGVSPPPPVAVLPLGTGNDLARALGWGGGYTDEPISKILTNVQDGVTVRLDRWDVRVEKNTDVDPSTCEEGRETFPLNVFNNYFSLGVDAHIALEFHEAREAHPEKFSSRLRNKMFYGQVGGKDLLQRKWKDLSSYVQLECDDQDMTPRLKELRVHSILFLNIPSYGGGTHPWGNSSTSSFGAQKTDDGLIEVIGLTTYQLPFLQAGGHGTCIAQCRRARLVTTRTIPMQVDGEPCKLLPSTIDLRLRNTANMTAKAKRTGVAAGKQILEKLTLQVRKLNMSDYETYHYDKEKLQDISAKVGSLCVNQDTDLEGVRKQINELMQNGVPNSSSHVPAIGKLPSNWCFLDSCTAERFFRIDCAQEYLHYVVDICADKLYILDQNQPEISPPAVESTSTALDSLPEQTETSPVQDGHPNILRNTTGCNRPSGGNHSRELLEKNTEDFINAAKVGDIARVRLLHENGYSLMTIDQSGMTALHHAARYGHEDVVEYLIVCGPKALLDITDNEKGQTALHKAAAKKRQRICCMLVSGGASLTRTDYRGKTARRLAEISGDKELATYLENQEHFLLSVDEKETVV